MTPGLDPASVPVYEIRINDDAEASYWTKQFLKRKRGRPTAIFSMSDRMAFGALRAATQLGLKVPRDVSIIGPGYHGRNSVSIPAHAFISRSYRLRSWISG